MASLNHKLLKIQKKVLTIKVARVKTPIVEEAKVVVVVEKKKRQVKFNEDVVMVENLVGRRTWNDSSKRRGILTRGQFTDGEVKTLMNALCSYVKTNNLTVEDLICLCQKPKEELGDDLKGSWCKIAECL